MDPLCDPLTTCPIQTGWEYTMEPYPSGQFGFIDDPYRQFGNGSVWIRTRTRSDGPEPLLILLEAQRTGCTSITTGATVARNSTGATWLQWDDSKLQNRRCATRICVYTFPASQRRIFQSWSICQGTHTRWRFYPRFAHWWWSIHRLVHYQLCGNAANSYFVDDGSLLSEHDTEDESRRKGTGLLSIIIIPN